MSTDTAALVRAEMPRVEYLLRRLLAHQVAGTRGYYDDGELQDNSRPPFVDFLRDHPKDIELKLIERNADTIERLTRERDRWMSAAVSALESLEWHASSCCDSSIPDETVEALSKLRAAITTLKGALE